MNLIHNLGLSRRDRALFPCVYIRRELHVSLPLLHAHLSMAVSTPADIYAEQLIPLGYGYPLWQPEPTKHGEVLIGDVGFISGGCFYRLFNAMLPQDDPINARGVPEEFQVLEVDNTELLHAKDEFLPPGPLHTTSVTSKKASETISAQPCVSAL